MHVQDVASQCNECITFECNEALTCQCNEACIVQEAHPPCVVGQDEVRLMARFRLKMSSGVSSTSLLAVGSNPSQDRNACRHQHLRSKDFSKFSASADQPCACVWDAALLLI